RWRHRSSKMIGKAVRFARDERHGRRVGTIFIYFVFVSQPKPPGKMRLLRFDANLSEWKTNPRRAPSFISTWIAFTRRSRCATGQLCAENRSESAAREIAAAF